MLTVRSVSNDNSYYVHQLISSYTLYNLLYINPKSDIRLKFIKVSLFIEIYLTSLYTILIVSQPSNRHFYDNPHNIILATVVNALIIYNRRIIIAKILIKSSGEPFLFLMFNTVSPIQKLWLGCVRSQGIWEFRINHSDRFHINIYSHI